MKQSLIYLILVFLPLVSFTQNINDMKEYKMLTTDNYKELYTLYCHFHSNPELSFQEKETSKKVSEELKKIGYEVTDNFGGYGIVAVLKNGKGPTVLIRADMDALPIEEKTGLDYASKVKVTKKDGTTVSVMHACGHDMHMTVFLANAKFLYSIKDKWKGTLLLISQPAEEVSGGAKAMIKEGLFSKFPKPDYCLSLHVSPTIESGKIGYKAGPFFASNDMIDISVFGIGGHGAVPHETIDPIVLASRMILAFQTISSREISPVDPVVVTVGAIHGGTKHNIIPGKVDLQLTIRTYSDIVRDQTIKSLERICNGIALSAGLPDDLLPQINVREESTPALINDPDLTDMAQKVWKDILGKDNVLNVKAAMTAEDFAYYGTTPENIPICMFWLGTVSAEKKEEYEKNNKQLPGLHSSFYLPDIEKSIKTGIKSVSGLALYLFNN